MENLHPQSSCDVLAAVQWAVGEEAPLEIIGGGSKRAIGRPMQTAHTLDLSALSGVTLYEPEELVISAKAGTSLAEIEHLLDQNNQEFQFEPMDYSPLLGLKPDDNSRQGTIGGLLSTNLTGPRRIKAGSARDHVLGINAVSGRGEMFKSGGRVVKNVTGYDLSKALTGAWGTLAAVTDVTFKVLPKAETEQTLLIHGLTDEDAASAMATAMGSMCEVSGAAHMPAYTGAGLLGGSIRSQAATLLRLEGVAPSVAYRIDHLGNLLREFGTQDRISDEKSKTLWHEIRDVYPFAEESGKQVWRLSVTPARGHEIVGAIRQIMAAEALYDWQGGLIWLAVDEGSDGTSIRHIVATNGGGHATLIRAKPETRIAVPVFQPQPAALAALSQRLRENFDPKGILNPGRMVAY